jgi:tRNA uridine 5-carboxymethylaminomethyl modification enzyme
MHNKKYDVIVVGGGHAGVEAALAASRMGCETILFTMNVDTIGQMSCNPAIGGLGKGHLVREIDALGGEMGINTDATGIQFRLLNTSKGPSVWAPRAQCDKKAYQNRLKWVCEKQILLEIKQDHITNILHNHGTVIGVETKLGLQFLSKTVIITTGTFLKGLMHIGTNQQVGGRLGDGAASGLSESLIKLGIKLGRFKTGTPPRLLKRTIDFSKMEIQNGDSPKPFFSFWQNNKFHVEQTQFQKSTTRHPIHLNENHNTQLPCYLTYTTQGTAKIIKDNITRSPLYSGIIKGTGPRYCPSIEDKIIKFSEKEKHQIFLEPEGVNTDEIYVNGLSTSLPYDIQIQLVRSLIGCEKAQILRPAYAVEYDFAYSTQIKHTLETNVCRGLYLAGQINGTSGYEEAAAQGLMAGINAVLQIRNMKPMIFQRNQAYIGVLIDDLVSIGIDEPYRIFTSRAEYRLLLRQDNADFRLSQFGYNLGLLSKENYDQVVEKKKIVDNEIHRLESTFLEKDSLAKKLSRPGVIYDELPGANLNFAKAIVDQIEISIKYAGYISRQEEEVMKLKKLYGKEIPDKFDFSNVYGLRLESRQKLSQIKPKTIGQACKISGVSAADVVVLVAALRKGN